MSKSADSGYSFRSALFGVAVVVWLTLVGIIELQARAARDGYLADLMGNPTTIIVPRWPWELVLLLIVVSGVAVWLLREFILRLSPSERIGGFTTSAVLIAIANVFAGVNGYGVGTGDFDPDFVLDWVLTGTTSSLGVTVLAASVVLSVLTTRERTRKVVADSSAPIDEGAGE